MWIRAGISRSGDGHDTKQSKGSNERREKEQRRAEGPYGRQRYGGPEVFIVQKGKLRHKAAIQTSRGWSCRSLDGIISRGRTFSFWGELLSSQPSASASASRARGDIFWNDFRFFPPAAHTRGQTSGASRGRTAHNTS